MAKSGEHGLFELTTRCWTCGYDIETQLSIGAPTCPECNSPLLRCWKCRVDVSDEIGHGASECPNCASPIDDLRYRALVSARRKNRLRSACFGVAGVLALVVVQFQGRGSFGMPGGPLVGPLLLAALTSIALSFHFGNRTSWMMRQKSFTFVAVRWFFAAAAGFFATWFGLVLGWALALWWVSSQSLP